MKNYVTGREYTGQNAVVLAEAGVESVLTFKQATKSLGIAGKKLKGLKAVARLVIFREDEETGEKRPRYFSVFDATEVLARAGV